MHPKDERFIALDEKTKDGKKINLENYAVCKYFFQTHKPVLEAAIDLCKSQSTSSAGWGASGEVAGEDDEIVETFGAKLLRYHILEESTHADMPAVNQKIQQNRQGKLTRAEVEIAIPLRNLERGGIPLLMTALAGEIHYLDPFISIKLVDLKLPESYLKLYQGPKFGVEGLRNYFGIKEDRPLLIGVIKPSLAPPKLFADLAYETWIGGIDMVKDDELLVDIDESPFEERMKAVAEAKKRAEKEKGRSFFYQANITGPVDDLKRKYEIARRYNVDAIMISAVAQGLGAVHMLTGFTEIPVSSHFDLTACMAKSPYHGVSHKVMALIHRLAGIDNLIMPAYDSTMMEYEEDINAEVAICAAKIGELKHMIPFFGGGVKATNIAIILKKAKTNKVGLIVGHGIYAHPEGARAGAKSIVQAWEAYHNGKDIEEYAATHQELKRALEHFGYKKQ